MLALKGVMKAFNALTIHYTVKHWAVPLTRAWLIEGKGQLPTSGTEFLTRLWAGNGCQMHDVLPRTRRYDAHTTGHTLLHDTVHT